MNSQSDAPPIGFTGGGLKRMENERTDAAWLGAVSARPDSVACLISGEEIAAVTPEDKGFAPFWTATAALDKQERDRLVLLGIDQHERAYFALEAAPERIAELARGRGLEAAPVPLRALAASGAIPDLDLARLAHGKSMLNWHSAHRFCARCGAKTQAVHGGAKRQCPQCGGEHFPRVDPVAIMLVVNGGNCVLARQSRFPPGMYSALAGYIEPGETFDEAVRREVMEEAGIVVGRVDFLATQPWPFPSSLMIGCHAEALTTELIPDEEELEDLRWFSRTDAARILDGGHDEIRAPARFAIAHHLLSRFVNQG
jgi:NAD+ diphosphatase